VTKILSMLNKSMINSMLPFSMLSSCRCYSFDDNFFEVDVPVFDFTYFSQDHNHKNILQKATYSQKVCENSICSGDQGGESTLSQC